MKVFDIVVDLDKADEVLKPGITTTNKLVVGKVSKVLSVPIIAVFEEKGATHVFVANGSSYERRKVKLGQKNDKLRSGGEKVYRKVSVWRCAIRRRRASKAPMATRRAPTRRPPRPRRERDDEGHVRAAPRVAAHRAGESHAAQDAFAADHAGHRLRCGAVIAMLSIGEGARQESLEQIEILGVRNVIVRSLDVPAAEMEANPQSRPLAFRSRTPRRCARCSISPNASR